MGVKIRPDPKYGFRPYLSDIAYLVIDALAGDTDTLADEIARLAYILFRKIFLNCFR